MKKILTALALAGAMTLAPQPGTCPMTAAAAAQDEVMSITDVTLTNVRDESNVQLAQLCADKPLVLNFWASWCPPCVGELPHFNTMYGKYGDRLNFAAVSLDDSMADARGYLGSRGADLALPFYYGDTAFICRAYQLQAIPVTLLVAPGGAIIAEHLGGMSEAELESFLQYAL